MVVRPVIQEVE